MPEIEDPQGSFTRMHVLKDRKRVPGIANVRTGRSKYDCTGMSVKARKKTFTTNDSSIGLGQPIT